MCLSMHAFAFDLLRCVDLTKVQTRFKQFKKMDLKMAFE